ncbi:MAG: glucose-6-phosphate isomerase family protein [Actinomycetota bacterium]
MTELPAPFTTLLDLADGRLEPQRDLTERRLSDLDGYYQNQTADSNNLVYRVFGIPVPETNSEVLCSTTVLEAGEVGGEYYMTKGHFHTQRDRAEIYIGLSGEGRLVMATEDGRHAVETMRRGTVNYIPGGWAHRSVNVGEEPLVFFAAYIGDAGHDYEAIERRGFPVLVKKGEDGPLIVENPGYRKQ